MEFFVPMRKTSLSNAIGNSWLKFFFFPSEQILNKQTNKNKIWTICKNSAWRITDLQAKTEYFLQVTLLRFYFELISFEAFIIFYSKLFKYYFKLVGFSYAFHQMSLTDRFDCIKFRDPVLNNCEGRAIIAKENEEKKNRGKSDWNV